MKNLIKAIVKRILFVLHLDITRNQRYDRQTLHLLRRILQPETHCIDIGCHKGEIMDLMLKYAPKGQHRGFEPIPALFEKLRLKYASVKQVSLYSCALSDQAGETTFNYVVNAPAYSGIRQRKYDRKDARIEVLNVKLEKLDDLIPSEEVIGLIKIDVEGAEYQVMKGARQTIRKNKPYIIFECGLGATDYYGVNPNDIYSLLADECGLRVSLLESWLNGKPPLTKDGFRKEFDENSNYYFLAHP